MSDDSGSEEPSDVEEVINKLQFKSQEVIVMSTKLLTKYGQISIIQSVAI
jgi:hypothetical protein